MSWVAESAKATNLERLERIRGSAGDRYPCKLLGHVPSQDLIRERFTQPTPELRGSRLTLITPNSCPRSGSSRPRLHGIRKPIATAAAVGCFMTCGADTKLGHLSSERIASPLLQTADHASPFTFASRFTKQPPLSEASESPQWRFSACNSAAGMGFRQQSHSPCSRRSDTVTGPHLRWIRDDAIDTVAPVVSDAGARTKQPL